MECDSGHLVRSLLCCSSVPRPGSLVSASPDEGRWLPRWKLCLIREIVLLLTSLMDVLSSWNRRMGGNVSALPQFSVCVAVSALWRAPTVKPNKAMKKKTEAASVKEFVFYIYFVWIIYIVRINVMNYFELSHIYISNTWWVSMREFVYIVFVSMINDQWSMINAFLLL